MSTDPSQPAEPDPLVPDLPLAGEEPVPVEPPAGDLTEVDSSGVPIEVSTDAEGNVVEENAPAEGEQGPVAQTNPVDPAGAPADGTVIADDSNEVETQELSGAQSGNIVTTPADALSPRPIEVAGVGVGTPPNESQTPPIAETSTSPFTGEQILTGDNQVIVPLAGVDEHADVIADPSVPVVAAHEDPHGAAQAVLDQDRPEAEQVVPSRAEVMAQRVLDEGTLTPAVAGNATAPVETLDHHTVDPSGTADDSQPGAFVEERVSETDTPPDLNAHPGAGTDAATATFDTRVADADRAAKGQTVLPPELGEELIVSSVKALAENGFHKDLVHQWVDQAFADLQGQRSSAQSAGQDDPYPGLAI